MRIALLVHNVYGVGGTNRTVINLAEELSRRHQVEIVSILRRLDRPMLDVPAWVPVIGLVDLRSGAADTKDPRGRELSRLVPAEEELYRFYSRLSDERITDYLRRSPADVVVGTRSALSLCVAKLGRSGTVRIGQEHMTQDMIPKSVHEEMRRHYHRLAAVTTVTEADAAVVRNTLGADSPPVRPIPNSVPEPRVAPADSRSKIVVAAGRLDEIKRYDLLVHAFAKVITERPDWTLRIYGGGGQARPLAALIADLELHNHVFLMGSYAPLDAEWVKGSIAAVTSDRESFGMTIVEAMRCGLPVVSTACPVGPTEIINDGVDGLLVPTGDVNAIAAALLRLMNDDELRARLGAAARTNARRYDPAPIAARYEQLFQRHQAQSGLRRRAVSAVLAGPVRKLRSEGRAVLQILAGLPGRGGPDASPVADCRTVDGEIVVEVTSHHLLRGMTHLVCRPRKARTAGEPVRLLLTGDASRWQASFPADEPLLAEGRWDIFLAHRRGRLHRLRAGLLDVRGLLGGCAETAPFIRNVPYQTADGFLAVAAWRRDQHAEVEQIWYGGETVTVTGRLVAGVFGKAVPMLALNRRGEYPATLTVPGTSSGAADFTIDVPLSRLAALRALRHEDWDAAVSAGPDGELVPMARLMDDIIERKKVFAYPPALVDEDLGPEMYEETPVSEVRVKPYYSVQSGLAFIVSDRPI